MFPDGLLRAAEHLLADLKAAGLKIATAESCTGGLIASLLTEIPSSSQVFERGFVTYSNAAKIEMLGVDPTLITNLGAVSREVAIAMAEGAIRKSKADAAVAVTGVAGPGGGTIDKPVGLVHIAVIRRNARPLHQESRFSNQSRSEIRKLTVAAAMDLVRRACLSS